MKEVDLREKLNRVSPKYAGVPQPMKVLHSIEEFKTHVAMRGKFYLIRNLTDFTNFLHQHDLIKFGSYTDVTKLNVWIATGEKAVPDYWNKDDIIIWKLDEKGNIIKTDNCFIQVFSLFCGKNKYTLYTSSGIYNASMSKWRFSAAIKGQFMREFESNPSTLGGKNYERALEHYLSKKRANLRELKVIHLILNPLNEDYFCNPDAAIKAVFKGQLKKKDYNKLITSEKFRKLFAETIGVLMPTLSKAFKDNIKDKEMVDMALGIFKKATESGTVDDSIKAYDLIYTIRESDADAAPAIPQVGAPKNGHNALAHIKEQAKPPSLPGGSVNILNEYEDDDLKIVDLDAESLPDDPKEKERRLAELRKETGSLGEFVQ